MPWEGFLIPEQQIWSWFKIIHIKKLPRPYWPRKSFCCLHATQFWWIFVYFLPKLSQAALEGWGAQRAVIKCVSSGMKGTGVHPQCPHHREAEIWELGIPGSAGGCWGPPAQGQSCSHLVWPKTPSGWRAASWSQFHPQHTSPDAKILEVLAEAVILNETLNLGRVSEGWAPAWPSRGADMDSWHLGRQAGFSTSGIHVYQTWTSFLSSPTVQRCQKSG